MPNHPDWRLREAQALDPDDPLHDNPTIERLRRTLDDTSPDPDTLAALELFDDDKRRAAIEGYLLAGMSPQELCTRFNVPQAVLEAFRRAFFDLEYLQTAEKALLTLADDVPAVVLELRRLGLYGGVSALDHALGVRPLDDTQIGQLQRQLEGRLLAKAMTTADTTEMGKLISMIARLRASSSAPSEPASDPLPGLLAGGWPGRC